MVGQAGAAKAHQSITTEGTAQEILTNTETIIAALGGGGQSHLDLFTGDIYYVDAARPDDTGNGETPETAKKTMLAGIALMAAGDRLKVKAGAYDEDGMALTLTGQQLICEAGAIFVNSTPATVFTVSGLGCVVDGAHFVQAGAIGLHITGIGAIVRDTIAVNCTVGFDIDQHSTQMFTCVAAGSTVTAFDIGAQNTTLRECFAPGTGAATRGFYLSAAAVTRTLLDQCHSVGNATAGFEIVAGANGNTISFSSSGGGDGRRVNAGANNVFSNFSPNEHAILFGGSVWYVDGTNGAATNDGLTPTTAFDTIGAAIASTANGDAINIRTGIYDENGLDIANDGIEIWAEIGAQLIDTVGGAQTLLVSGDYCRVNDLHVNQAGQPGIRITGTECWLENTGVHAATIAYDVDGAANVFIRTYATGYTVTGYDFATAGTLLKLSAAVGTGGATRGYYFSTASSDQNTLDDCVSIGNGTAGFEIVAGASFNTIKDSSSGGGDGSTVDNGSYNNWPGYTDQLATEHHEDIYPLSNGQGAAGDPVTLSNATTDGGGGQRDDQNYWGDITRIIPPDILTARWRFIGIYIHATTANDVQQYEILFTYATMVSAQNGGNDWDENEVDLTVVDGSLFENGDHVWITGNDRAEGEIMFVSGAPVGNVVTLARETTADGEAGLRYDYDATGVNNRMYLVKRDGVTLYEGYEGDFSAPGGRYHERYQWHEPKQLAPNGGMLMRMLNATDNGASTFDVRAIYED